MERLRFWRPFIAAGVTLALGLALWLPVAEADEESFFSGKQIRIIGGFAPGGSIDLRSRLFARHLPKYIPGKPTVIVQSMPGAGGLIAANHTFEVAEPDGLTILHFPSSTIANAFLAPAKAKYDIRKINILWAQDDSWLTVIEPNATRVRAPGDILKTKAKLAVGASGVTSLRSLRPKLALELYGVEHTWVSGYRGTAGLLAAFDRGEIHLFEVPIASYKPNVLPREKEGKLQILWQTGTLDADGKFHRSKYMPDLPTFAEVLPEGRKGGVAWEAWQAAVVPQAFQSSVGLRDGVPADRLEVLTRAFESLQRDPEYLADYERVIGQPAEALIGDQASRVVQAGLRQLFEDYAAGVKYLRELPNK